MKFWKLAVSFLLTFSLAVGTAPFVSAADIEGTVQIDITYGQSEARSIGKMVNDFRTGNDAWYWNSANTEKVKYTDLSELTYDYGLEQVAMQRAAELAVSYAHTRPNGSECFTLYPRSGSVGENIAAGYNSAISVFNGWLEADEDFSGQGHRRNMLSSAFKAIGIGHVIRGRVHFWAMALGQPTNSAPTAANDSETTINVDVKSSNADVSIKSDKTSFNIGVGESVDLPTVTISLNMPNTWPISSSIPLSGNYPWVLGTSGYASISDSKITGIREGTTELTVSALGESLSIPITVCKHTYTSTITKAATCIEDGIKTFTCTVCGDTYTEKIKATGTHTYDSGKVTRNASCQSTGIRVYTCLKCGHMHSETVPALGHSYKNGLCIRCGNAEPNCPISKFNDIMQGQWYHDGIHFALEHGLMSGISKASFDPSGFLSRAMVAQILYANEDKPSVFSNSPFTDVADNAWYADAVAWAAEKGIVSGTGKNLFEPMNYVTREQLAVMLYGAADKPYVLGSLHFSDSSRVSNWAGKAMLWAVQNGIISGTSTANGTSILNPQGNATRAQAAVMIMRYVQLWGDEP